MARPRMDDMRAGADQPDAHADFAVARRNHRHVERRRRRQARPQPWRAKSVDLSLEKYFQKRSYVAVAGFLKKLDSFIYQRSTERDFTGFPNYNPDLTPGCSAVRAGLQSEHRHDHHAGQWQRRQGLRHRVVDLSGRWPVHARAGRFRRATE